MPEARELNQILIAYMDAAEARITVLEAALARAQQDTERLDWLAAEQPFDGFGGLDLHEMAFDECAPVAIPTLEQESEAYRIAIRKMIDHLRAGLTQGETP